MKTISSAMQAHLNGEVTTLAVMWRIERTDGVVLGFTSHDQDIVYNGVTYRATMADPSTTASSSGLQVDNTSITALLDDTAITEADLEAGLYDGARVYIGLVNWDDLTMGWVALPGGRFGQVDIKHGVAQVELRGLTQALQQTIGRSVGPGCGWDLGDSNCTVNLATYTVAGTVTAVTDRANFVDSGRAEAAAYFSNGVITWTSGANKGRRMEVKTFAAGGAFELKLEMGSTIAVGDTYSVPAGCDYTPPTCKTKFNNYVNYGGFPDIPGIDQVLAPPQ